MMLKHISNKLYLCSRSYSRSITAYIRLITSSKRFLSTHKYPPEWVKLAAKETKLSDPIPSLEHPTVSGITFRPLYTSKQTTDELPGFYPYTRGIHGTMYVNRPWTLRQYSGYSTAEESNKFFLHNIKMGQQGLSVAFDLPTLRGYDSDNKNVSGEVGLAGVAIDTVEDMKILFKDIPLNKISVSFTINGATIPTLAMLIVTYLENNWDPLQLRGTIQNDILKEFITQNTYIYPPIHSLRIISDIMKHLHDNHPKFNSISISGYHMQEAGADPVTELGFTIANGLEYARCAIKAGLDIDDMAPRFSFFFGMSMDFYMEIAKLRAARRVWAKLMKEKFECKNPKSMLLRTHCQTSGWSLQEQDPLNNIIRTTIEGLSAVFGGTQSLHCNCYDEAMALPSVISERIARNTQLIIQHETSICNVVDPWGGSHFMEQLTDDIEEKVMDIINNMENEHHIESKIAYARNCIEECATKKQANIDIGNDVIVGVNKFQLNEQELEDSQIDVLHIDSNDVYENQIKRIKEVKSKRDEIAVQKALKDLTKAANNEFENNDNNVLKYAVIAAKHRATVGEISDAMENIFGRYVQNNKIVSGAYHKTFTEHNESEFNKVIQNVNDFEKKFGRRPRILVAKLGQDGHDRGMKVIASGFADLGFDVDVGPLFATVKEVAKQAMDSDVHCIGISSQAAEHLTLVPQLIDYLNDNGMENVIIVVGGVIPPQDYAKLYEIGVSRIFGPGTKVIEAVQQVLDVIKAFYFL